MLGLEGKHESERRRQQKAINMDRIYRIYKPSFLQKLTGLRYEQDLLIAHVLMEQIGKIPNMLRCKL